MISIICISKSESELRSVSNCSVGDGGGSSGGTWRLEADACTPRDAPNHSPCQIQPYISLGRGKIRPITVIQQSVMLLFRHSCSLRDHFVFVNYTSSAIVKIYFMFVFIKRRERERERGEKKLTAHNWQPFSRHSLK